MRYIYLALSFVFLFLCATSLSAQEKVRPKLGDGISTLLYRHGRGGLDYQKEFIELNKGKLGKNNSLLHGVTYVLPPKKKASAANAKTSSQKPASKSTAIGSKHKETLFGSKYVEYEITSHELKGATFYVVSGHGGPDPGAIGKMGGHELHEDEYAYDIILRLARNLMMRGAIVHIIIQDAQDGIRDDQALKNSNRETCMGDPIPLNQIARLNQRSEKINYLHKKTKGYARSIFVHVDSRSRDRRMDVFFYHSSSAPSKRLANTMKDTFGRKYDYHQPGRGFTGTVSERNLHVLRNTVPVAVYVEVANIQSPFDQQRIVLENNRQALANWMCDAFIADYKVYQKK